MSIRRIRKRQNLTQSEFANAVGLTQGELSRLENIRISSDRIINALVSAQELEGCTPLPVVKKRLFGFF